MGAAAVPAGISRLTDLGAGIDCCCGRENRRATAVLRLFLDTGVRVLVPSASYRLVGAWSSQLLTRTRSRPPRR